MVSKLKHNIALNLDLIGFSASTICAIHCALMPILFLILPLIGLGFATNSLFEYSFILISLIIGTFTFKHGYLNHHKRLYPLGIFISGLTLVIVSHFLIDGHSPHTEAETLKENFTDNFFWILAPVGALMIAVSHFINRKLSKNIKAGKCKC